MAALAGLVVGGGGDELGRGTRLHFSTGLPTTTPVRLWVTDESVFALEVAGGKVFAGGSFSLVGPRTGSLAVFRHTSRAALLRAPVVEGGVDAIVSDGAGGWILGGAFTRVGGRRCRHLAHVTRRGQLDARFCLQPDRPVLALARRGSTVYIGGEFKRVGKFPRLRLAALDLRSGRVLSWTAPVTGRAVYDRSELVPRDVRALVVADRSLFVGGFFERVGSARRTNLAVLNAQSGRPLPWRVDVGLKQSFERVNTLLLHGGRLYVGGSFSRVAGLQRPLLAALDPSNGRLASLRFPPNLTRSEVASLAAGGGRLYIGTRGEEATLLVADLKTGRFTADRRFIDGEVRALAVSRNRIYVGGGFGKLGGQDRANVAALNVRTGALLGWHSLLNGGVSALSTSNGRIAVGGDFTSAGGFRRHGLAAFNARTGALLPWQPIVGPGPASTSDQVAMLAATNATLVVEGSFGSIDGQARDGLAAFDLARGGLTPWAPQLTPIDDDFELLQGLAIDGGTAFISGEFRAVGGQPRLRLAALGLASGEVSAWNPELRGTGRDGYIAAVTLAPTANVVYVAGDLDTVAGVPREGLAAVDRVSGAVLSWTPPLDFSSGLSVNSAGAVVYIRGDFETFSNATRKGLAAVEADSGKLLPWDARLAGARIGDGPSVFSMTVADGIVGITGDFTVVRGQRRGNGVALLDAETGSLLGWSPRLHGPVDSFDTIALGESALAGTDGFGLLIFPRRP